MRSKNEISLMLMDFRYSNTGSVLWIKCKKLDHVEPKDGSASRL